VTPPAALAAQRATKTIPIVFVYAFDPVKIKLVESLGRPGGNITGFSTMQFEISAKRLEILKECIVGLRRVVLLINPDDKHSAARFVENTVAAGNVLDVVVQSAEVREPSDIEQVFATLTKEHVGRVISVADAFLEICVRKSPISLRRGVCLSLATTSE
jgi:putative ABC transport system substrate-binding protein